MGGVLGTQYKKVPKPIVHPNVHELEWAAGFLEGEGNFTRTRRTEMVRAAQVNKDPLIRLQFLFGGSIKRYMGGGKNQKPYYLWLTTGARARGIAMTLYSLLFSDLRKKQIRKALQIESGEDRNGTKTRKK
jgi:hypothetical protein